MAKTTLQVFAPLLRKAGFRKDGPLSHFSGCRIVVYRKEMDEHRTLEAQLWSDGNHRMSHWINGRMNTIPTDFTTPEGLAAAIERETLRTDNKVLREPRHD